MPLFQLGSAVDRQGPINPDDILRTKRVLNKLGHYPIPNHGITDFTDDEMFEGVEAFQRERDLPVDGVMTPDGPTARAINAVLTVQDQDRRNEPSIVEREAPFSLGLVRASSRNTPFGQSVNRALRSPGSPTPKVLNHVGRAVERWVDEGIEDSRRALGSFGSSASQFLSRIGKSIDGLFGSGPGTSTPRYVLPDWLDWSDAEGYTAKSVNREYTQYNEKTEENDINGLAHIRTEGPIRVKRHTKALGVDGAYFRVEMVRSERSRQCGPEREQLRSR